MLEASIETFARMEEGSEIGLRREPVVVLLGGGTERRDFPSLALASGDSRRVPAATGCLLGQKSQGWKVLRSVARLKESEEQSFGK